MVTEKAVLLIDNSNGRTKFCLWERGGLKSEIRILATKDISEYAVKQLTTDWCYSSVYVSSVVPNTAEILSRSFCCPVYFLRSEAVLPIDFSSYSGKETLGSDRIANVMGAIDWHRFPVIAVDLGTAITFDVLLEKTPGSYMFAGGVIAPGLSLFKEYLPSRTALLPQLSDSFHGGVEHIGQDTQEALHFGFISGARGMVRSILSDIAASLGTSPFIVATGGDAPWAAQHLPEIDVIDTHLTFRGLAKFAYN